MAWRVYVCVRVCVRSCWLRDLCSLIVCGWALLIICVLSGRLHRFARYHVQHLDQTVHAADLPKPPRLTASELTLAPVVDDYFQFLLQQKEEEQRKREEKRAAEAAKRALEQAEAKANRKKGKKGKRGKKGKKKKPLSRAEKVAALVAAYEAEDEEVKYYTRPRHHSIILVTPFDDELHQPVRADTSEPMRDPVIPDEVTLAAEREAAERAAAAAVEAAEHAALRKVPSTGFARHSVDKFVVHGGSAASQPGATAAVDDAEVAAMTKPVVPERPRSAPLGLFPPIPVAPEEAHVPVHPLPPCIRRCPRYMQHFLTAYPAADLDAGVCGKLFHRRKMAHRARLRATRPCQGRELPPVQVRVAWYMLYQRAGVG